MKLEHKIGIAITCTFLCLTGAVIGLKLQEQSPHESSSVAAMDPGEPTPIPNPSLEARSNREQGHKDKDAPLVSSSVGNGGKNGIGRPAPAQSQERTEILPAPPASSSSLIQPPSRVQGDLMEKSNKDNRSELNPNDDSTKRNAQQKSSSPSTTGNSPTFTIAAPTGFDSGVRTNSNTQTKKIESLSQPQIDGMNQWSESPRKGSDTKQDKPSPPLTKNDPKSDVAKSISSMEVKQSQPAKNPYDSRITQTSSNGLLMTSDPLPPPNSPSPPPAAPTTINPGSASTITSPAAGSSKPSASPSYPALPSYFQDQSTSPQKPLDPKSKDQNATQPTLAADKLPATSNISSTAPPPSPSLISPTVPPPSTSPTALPTTTPTPVTSPQSSSPSPGSNPPPITNPPATVTPISPTTTTPAPTITTPQPPKPPAEGSTYIPDNRPAPSSGSGTSSGSSSGPVGVMPAPLPLPTLSSTPLSSGSDKPAAAAGSLTPIPAQPVSKGPSVTVYSEQEYVCQSGDTWESLSKRFYLNTDRFAKALQRHNQNHFRASDQMVQTGRLAPGERVFIPQANVLEEKYADAIMKPSPAATPTMMPAAFTGQSSSPPPPPPPANGSTPPPPR
jgi:hypothetical protein